VSNSALFYSAELGQELGLPQLSAAQASLTCGGFAGTVGCSWDGKQQYPKSCDLEADSI